MYKYKLKEIEVGDTDIRKGVKTTVSDVDPETGAITYDVENVADFSSTYNALQQARQFLDTLEKTGKAKDDPAIDQFAEEIAGLFNAFRSHVRKNYPKEYERVLRLKEENLNENKGQKAMTEFIKVVEKASNSKEIFEKFENLINVITPGAIKEEEIDEQSSTAMGGDAFAGGEGAQYATPFAFRKKGKKGPSIYYYKLGYKPVPKIKPKGFDIKKLF